MAWYNFWRQPAEEPAPEAPSEPVRLSDFGILQDASGSRYVVNFNSNPGAVDPNDVERLMTGSVPYGRIELDGVVEDGLEVDGLGRDEWLAEFWRMQEDDAVGDALNYHMSYLYTLDYYIEPSSEAEEDLDMAAFVADSLGLDGRRNGKYPWERILKAYELALTYGRSAGEVVMAEGDNGLAVMDKFVPIHPFNIEDILRDARGGPKSLQLRGTALGENGKPIDKKVPFYKLVYYVNDDEGDMWGRSLLRRAWVNWKIKRAMLQLVNAGFERFLLGIPVLKVPNTVQRKSPEWNEARQTLIKFAMKPRTGMLLPNGYEFEIQVVNNQMPDAIPYLRMQDEAIYRAMGVGFSTIGKGDNASGSYTQANLLGDSSKRFAERLLKQFLSYTNAYLIPKLVLINWPDAKVYPALRVSRMKEADPASILNAHAQMVSASMGEGGFNEEHYRSMLKAAPSRVKELMGIDVDERRAQVESRRQSVR